MATETLYATQYTFLKELNKKQAVISEQDDLISTLTVNNQLLGGRGQVADQEIATLKEDCDLLVRVVKHHKEMEAEAQEQLDMQASLIRAMKTSHDATCHRLEQENKMLRQALNQENKQFVDNETLRKGLKRKRDQVAKLDDELLVLKDELESFQEHSLKVCTTLVGQRDTAIREAEQWKRYAKLTAIETGSFIHSGRVLRASRDTVGKVKTVIHVFDHAINNHSQ
jgi:chromosome segregation ATPase